MNKAIDLKPTSADAYRYRCSARIAKRDFTGAISDCSKTLSLNPRYVDAYFARGNAYNALSEWGAGIADLTQTIKLDPRASDAYNHRAWPYLILNRNDLAYSDAASYLRLEGATGENVSYVVLIAYFAKKQAGEANAAAILDEWGPRIKSAAWPYAVIRYLRHEMNEQELLGSAKDKEQTIESRAYLGMSLLLPGQREAALPHLNWVRENGSQEVYECGWTVECVAPFGGRCEVTGGSSTLGMSQVLRVTVNGRDGNDTFRVRFAWMKYMPAGCNTDGVCRHTLQSQGITAPVNVGANEAASYDVQGTGGGVRVNVFVAAGDVNGDAEIINTATGEVTSHVVIWFVEGDF